MEKRETMEAAEDYLKELDLNEDGKVSKDEFITVMWKMTEANKE